MELKVFRDTLSAAGSFCTVKSEIPIETEILISDYLPQVFKIVKCFVKMVVLQKQLQSGRLTLDGYLRCVVYYQGENGQGLCQAEQKLPFNKALELPELEYSAWSAIVGGETEYLNCRAVNQRRVEVRGAYSIAASVFTQLQQEVITAVSDCGTEQKQLALSGTKSCASLDKLITADSEFDFEQPPAAVLDVTGLAQVREMKVISGKVVVKGEIAAQLAYRTGPEDTLLDQKITLPFNQILDIDGLSEDCKCFCTVEPVGFTLSSAEEGEGKNQLSVSAMLHLRAFRDYEIDIVSDVFSTQFETESAANEILAETLEKEIGESETVQVAVPLSEESAQLTACFATLAAPELAPAGDKTQLRVRGLATALYKNSLGEIESADKPFELTVPLAGTAKAEDLHVECWAGVENIAAGSSGGMAELSVSLRLDGFVLCRRRYPGVASVTVGELLQPADPEVALRIYYAHTGEQVFDIARRFHVSPGEMMRVNELSEETLSAGRRLLVPGVG
ncbi:MAG: DUF3794 domain-containing protein [Faecalibacterium sp.]|jgi:hypothetical protein|nr:DUF3794 domain-containing protein [Faecalibacterium sp.]